MAKIKKVCSGKNERHRNQAALSRISIHGKKEHTPARKEMEEARPGYCMAEGRTSAQLSPKKGGEGMLAAHPLHLSTHPATVERVVRPGRGTTSHTERELAVGV